MYPYGIADCYLGYALVKPGLVHYNRNGWMRTHRWNAGCLRRICH